MLVAIDRFKPIVRDALTQFLKDRVRDKLQTALDDNQNGDDTDIDSDDQKDQMVQDDGIITTQDELDDFNIVRAIVRQTVDVSRVFYRDHKSHMSILLDDNNRKPICKLHFNRPNKKYIELVGEYGE